MVYKLYMDMVYTFSELKARVIVEQTDAPRDDHVFQNIDLSDAELTKDHINGVFSAGRRIDHYSLVTQAFTQVVTLSINGEIPR